MKFSKCFIALHTMFNFLFIFLPLLGTLKAEKIRYISTEHPEITDFNPKYMAFINLTSQRYGRNDPFYYVGMHMEFATTFNNNISVHFYFYEYLTNRYRRGFVEMHFLLCDLLEKDLFFGTPLRQGKFLKPCPHRPGVYDLYNMTIPVKHIPHNFPFKKGRIYCNITTTSTDELVASGFINMELKVANIKSTKTKP